VEDAINPEVNWVFKELRDHFDVPSNDHQKLWEYTGMCIYLLPCLQCVDPSALVFVCVYMTNCGTGMLANFLLNDINKEKVRTCKKALRCSGAHSLKPTSKHGNAKQMKRPPFKSADDNAKTLWKTRYMPWTLVKRDNKKQYPR